MAGRSQAKIWLHYESCSGSLGWEAEGCGQNALLTQSPPWMEREASHLHAYQQTRLIVSLPFTLGFFVKYQAQQCQRSWIIYSSSTVDKGNAFALIYKLKTSSSTQLNWILQTSNSPIKIYLQSLFLRLSFLWHFLAIAPLTWFEIPWVPSFYVI